MTDAVEPALARPDAPLLLYDRSCPFAQRVLALRAHLGCPLAAHEHPLGQGSQRLARYRASPIMPVLVDGDLVITESRVMLEHLAELHGFAEAYPAQLVARSRHRQAMAVVDDYLAALLVLPDADVDAARLRDALDSVEAALDTASPSPSLLVFHLAPLWHRLRWWRPSSRVMRAIEARERLRCWLDESLQLSAVVASSPDPKTHRADIARARALGVLPALVEEVLEIDAMDIAKEQDR